MVALMFCGPNRVSWFHLLSQGTAGFLEPKNDDKYPPIWEKARNIGQQKNASIVLGVQQAVSFSGGCKGLGKHNKNWWMDGFGWLVLVISHCDEGMVGM